MAYQVRAFGLQDFRDFPEKPLEFAGAPLPPGIAAVRRVKISHPLEAPIRIIRADRHGYTGFLFKRGDFGVVVTGAGIALAVEGIVHAVCRNHLNPVGGPVNAHESRQVFEFFAQFIRHPQHFFFDVRMPEIADRAAGHEQVGFAAPYSRL